jgi:hypothetical protein
MWFVSFSNGNEIQTNSIDDKFIKEINLVLKAMNLPEFPNRQRFYTFLRTMNKNKCEGKLWRDSFKVEKCQHRTIRQKSGIKISFVWNELEVPSPKTMDVVVVPEEPKPVE